MKTVFKAAKTLLTELKTLSLPGGSDAEVVVNDFGKFFVQNIHVNLSNNKVVFDTVGLMN